MQIILSSIIFVYGTILGSFYHVVALRLPRKLSFTMGRSYCPTCKKTLSWKQLIPLFSYIIQKGKCTFCKKKIPMQYFLIEMMTGSLFLFSFIMIGLSHELIIAFLLISLLMLVWVTDIQFMIIPNKILLIFLPIFLCMRVMVPLDPWYDSLIGSVLGYSIIACIIFISSGGMGAGDMKLFGVLGLVLGWKHIICMFFLSILFGAFIGFILQRVGKVHRKQAIPFAPFIVFATIITYFYGDYFIYLYLHLFRISL